MTNYNYPNYPIDNKGFATGIPIIITDRYKQRRTHKKKRINKKYAKKYGFVKCGLPLEDGKVYNIDGKLYMNQATFYKIRYAVDVWDKED
jgi:hypothetical protein